MTGKYYGQKELFSTKSDVFYNNKHTSEMVHNLPVTLTSMIQMFPSLPAFRVSFLIVSLKRKINQKSMKFRKLS